ncbi:hypothetical protein CO033_02635 [Candidatus Nomurabacteria bacterium CG_4_9_14_0_2_um_filter_32_10]|uniref:GIY-YIG domain-containing protein n=1 Tax=Candidatus Nomurabacteria bacterium CG_4_9_14_0_2_um_filter_32_10 TaxID=1974729 RepID=A0A2J0N2X5_9BACT|nr:MAG: hypothetical protein CO033_02635 [Candidatus Nomurabacteria bacterium CG_4_9_14_0_2_um_filter_32_10]
MDTEYYVYVILCKNNSLYIGQTNNLQNRWEQHCQGKGALWTKVHKPVKIVYLEKKNTLEEALKREKDLKTGFGRKWLKKLLAKKSENNLPAATYTAHAGEIFTPPTRLPAATLAAQAGDIRNLGGEVESIRSSRDAELCPYCLSKDFVKRGTRKNINQVVQLYLCRNEGCKRTFTATDVKGKHFPLHIVIESMNYYNLGFSLEETCKIIKKKFGVAPESATLSDWINEYKPLCRYERLRSYANKMFKPMDMIEVVTMAHRQLYRFRYHRAKTILMLEEFKNRNLRPLKNYLDNVSSETPHQYFQDGERMSEIRSKFDKADMIVRSKSNFANRLTAFVLQSIPDNKQRHEEVQRFMLANDSCTVATEVPVYIRKEDIEHMENELKFKIVGEEGIKFKGKKEGKLPKDNSTSEAVRSLPRMLTGHIDIIQIRNGQIHLLDYKPNASKERPIEQLTWYALAMSRLTGLRIFNFTCAWFDEKDYYQFYPLHVVKKLTGNKKRKFRYRSGELVEVPRTNELVIIKNKGPDPPS